MKARAIRNGIVPGCGMPYIKNHEYEVVCIDNESTTLSLCIQIKYIFTYLGFWVEKDDFELLEYEDVQLPQHSKEADKRRTLDQRRGFSALEQHCTGIGIVFRQSQTDANTAV